MAKPKLLIGSSMADRPVALAVASGVDGMVDVTLWCRGTFEPAGRFLDGLLDASREFDFAAFVLSDDDREADENLLLPLGMFLGALGRQRTFIVCSTDTVIELPSELRGVVAATYPPSRGPKVPPSVACACAILKEQILRLVPGAAPAKPIKAARVKQVERRRRRGALGTAYLVGPRRVLRIIDISMSGALLESYGEMPEGQMLDLDLALEDGSRIRATAQVARNQHPQWGKVGGVGVKFLRFEGEAKELLAKYIDAAPDAQGVEHELLVPADVPAR